MLPCSSLSNLPHIHKWVYVVGVRPWNLRTRKMRMWLNAHLVWKGHLWQNNLPPASQHPQLRQKEGRSHCWLPSEINRGPRMPARSNPWGGVSPSWWVRDITKKFPSLLWPTDYYPLLVFQVGSIKKALDNQEGPQDLGTIGWGTWSTLCSLQNCQWTFHVRAPHRLFKENFQQPSEIQRNGLSCSHIQHRIILRNKNK